MQKVHLFSFFKFFSGGGGVDVDRFQIIYWICYNIAFVSYFIFLAWKYVDLNFLLRGLTHTPCVGRWSLSTGLQGSPCTYFSLRCHDRWCWQVSQKGTSSHAFPGSDPELVLNALGAAETSSFPWAQGTIHTSLLISRNNSFVILNIWVFRLFCSQSSHAMILLLCLNL